VVRGQRRSTARTGTRVSGPTIRDVAAAAGVSTATVSYVLNDAPNQTISAATQQRVHAAADALGYILRRTAGHAEARSLPIVLLNVGTDTIGNSLSCVIHTMQEELRHHDCTLVVTAKGRHDMPELRRTLAPLAVVDITRESAGVRDDGDWGFFRGHQAGFPFHSRVQLQYLADLGHRHVGFAVPAGDIGVFGRRRIDHAHRAALELGLEPLTVVRLSMDPDPRIRTEAVRALVRESDVTAVAALDDDVALAFLASMAHLGYSAPDDLAVIGFDDEHQGYLWEPALTTVRIDTAAYGKRAAGLAVGAAAHDWIEAPSEVVERASG